MDAAPIYALGIAVMLGLPALGLMLAGMYAARRPGLAAEITGYALLAVVAILQGVVRLAEGDLGFAGSPGRFPQAAVFLLLAAVAASAVLLALHRRREQAWLGPATAAAFIATTLLYGFLTLFGSGE